MIDIKKWFSNENMKRKNYILHSLTSIVLPFQTRQASLLWFHLVSLFNGISTSVSYLVSDQSLENSGCTI